MPGFRFTWTNNDVPGDNPADAARTVWEMIRGLQAIPPVFQVEPRDRRTVDVDLMDGTVRTADTRIPSAREGNGMFSWYLATYPHPLPGLDTSAAQLMRVDQLRKGDVILGAMSLALRAARPRVPGCVHPPFRRPI
ncbi:hypothetical protein [Streptomyces albipurpureus]|uniref:Uncharacterized protein n=1 Tax=Streptomyces albipurpureus TaxID=2897419 RepID=A0ABT0UL20_9ACTN|nr:hypothetical protein [Streptomyces sp. CWNU-1]MCM2388805.1 hypothetical protein [Streptomyces sp. CWNU-1]